jgi:peptidoglycan/xylan/chitin deacetylase (PgdA/CDA1 family)
MLLIVVAAALGAFFFSHTAPFPFLLDQFERGRAIWEMPHRAGDRTVYLTFDDGPNPSVTPDLLDVLARERVTATFFLIDKYITAQTAPIVRRMFRDGHGVALHSDTPGLMFLPADELAARLTAAADRIEQLTGSRPCRAFRPHAGFRSSSMYEGLRKINHKLVGWGWMLWDWNWARPRTADSIVRRVVRRASAGDIIVIHDGHHMDPQTDRRYAVDATARLVPALRQRGFTFGSVCGAE